MEMPKPAPGHRRLEKLTGRWEGEETMYPSQWDPKGGVATGRIESRVAVSGFAVINDYQQERGGAVTFEGHGVWSYDPRTDRYTLHWFDSMASPPETFTGGFEGDVLTVSHGGPGMHARLTYDVTDPVELRSAMEMSMDGVIWKKLFDGRYRRR